MLYTQSNALDLVNALRNTARWRKILTGSIEQNIHQLAPAMTLAYLIYNDAIIPKEANQLRVLVAGAKDPVLRDQGTWFQAIIEMIARPRTAIEVTLVTELTDWPSSHDVSGVAPAKIHTGSLAEYVHEHASSISGFDLVLFEHPGFKHRHPEMLSPANAAALSSLIVLGIPCYITSYDRHEMELERQVARAYGFDIAPEISNPYAWDVSHGGMAPVSLAWGGVIASFTPQVPGADFTPAVTDIAGIKREPLPFFELAIGAAKTMMFMGITEDEMERTLVAMSRSSMQKLNEEEREEDIALILDLARSQLENESRTSTYSPPIAAFDEATVGGLIDEQ